MSIMQKQSLYTHISHILSKLDGKACILCYIIGLAWFLALAHHNLSAKTYFSENALLPGLVDTEFYQDYGAESYLNELKKILNYRLDSDSMYEIPSDWLMEKFRNVGIDAYVQDYSFKYPFGVYHGRNLTGQNVYGILRAPRSAGTEALVLSLPFRPDVSGEEATYPGIALMLAIAQAFRGHSYWAKDIIFLVTSNEEIGIQAWLSSYHHTKNEFISAGVLPSRSGSIQSAINLELSSSSIEKVNIKFEGLNGKLPNLDLINTVERMFYREGLKITIQKKSRDQGINEWSRYLQSLKTMLIMVWHQAPGTPTGNHGYFHKYNIEALTIQGYRGKAKKAFEFSDIGRVIEGIFRSLNNLLERFHQSFFFYLLPLPNRYVSIGVYMPPFGIMVLPIVIKALSAWLALSADKSVDKKPGEESAEGKTQNSDGVSKSEASSPSPSLEKSSDKMDNEEDEKQQEDATDKLLHVAIFIVSFLTGVGSLYASDFFVRSSHKFGLTPEEGLAFGFLIVHILVMLQPFIYKRHFLKNSDEKVVLNRNFLNCFTLLFFGISLGTISVMNISMAFLIAAVWVPIVLVNQVTKYKSITLIKYMAVTCTSPFLLLFVGSMVNQLLVDHKVDLMTLAFKSWVDLQDGLMLSAFQFYISDNWTFPLLNVVFLPIWSMFWFITTTN